MESMTEVTSEDLAGVYKDLAETVGDVYKRQSHLCGMKLESTRSVVKKMRQSGIILKERSKF